jgi:hypothetical protein
MGYYGLNIWLITFNMHSPSWSYGSRVGLAFSYYLYDKNDKPYIANYTFEVYGHPLYVNNSVLLMEKAYAPIQIDV